MEMLKRKSHQCVDSAPSPVVPAMVTQSVGKTEKADNFHLDKVLPMWNISGLTQDHNYAQFQHLTNTHVM